MKIFKSLYDLLFKTQCRIVKGVGTFSLQIKIFGSWTNFGGSFTTQKAATGCLKCQSVLKIPIMAEPTRQLSDLTEEEFEILKKMGFLYEFYPDAPEFHWQINGGSETGLILNVD